MNANNISSSEHKNQLESLLSSSQSPDIVGIMEAKIDSKSQFTTPHHDPLLFPHTRQSSGLAIFVSHQLNHQHCSQFSLSSSDQHLLSAPSMIEWIKVLCNNQEILIGFIYRHPQCSQDDWSIIRKSIDLVITSGLPFILTGDFNSRSTLWNDSANVSASDIQRLLEENVDLSVLNPVYASGQATHIRGSESSIIDLSITNAAHLIQDFIVDDQMPLSSDHIPIVTIISHDTQPPTSHARWHITTENMPQFLQYIDLFFHKSNFEMDLDNLEAHSPHNPHHTINSLCKLITDKITNAAEYTFPLYNANKNNFTQFISHSPDFHNALRSYHTMHTIYRHHHTQQNLQNLLDAKNRYKSILAREKTDYMQRMTDKLEDKTEWMEDMEKTDTKAHTLSIH